MEDGRVLADTSLFVQHLRARDKSSTRLYELTERFSVETSAVVASEIFYGARTKRAEKQAWSVLQPFPIHPFTMEMASLIPGLLADLVKRNRVPDIRDLMIAVAAIQTEIPLATLNVSHFESIPGLTLI